MSSKCLRILIVDDEHSIADTLALILNRSGHNALPAYGPVEAIDAAESFKPHTLLADVMMPGMNGIELASYFGTHFPACEVLLMTGNVDGVEIAEKYLPEGHYVKVLTKPVLPQTILSLIAERD